MIEVDGSQKSGSGTILRVSIALSAIRGEPLHIFSIRERRPEPGLKPQHLEAVLVAAKLCGADLKGAKLGSRELWFTPRKIKGGKIEAEIGTAGSIPMLLLTVLPICAFSEQTVQLHVSKGGTDVSNSPTINYLRFVLLPMLKHMGMIASLTVHRYGYYPRGMGEATLTVEPCSLLTPLQLEHVHRPQDVEGISVCTFLADRNVAGRQARAATNYLDGMGYKANIHILNDMSNPLQKGSSIVLWSESAGGIRIGADAIGVLGKPSETIGEEAAERICEEIRSCATVDMHLADMLIPYMALAKGESTYLTRMLSDHLQANMSLAQELLGVRFEVREVDNLYRVETSGRQHVS